MSTANCIISELELTQQYEQASESDVANLPCGRVYIPLGSQPLAQSYIRYIDMTRASCPKTPCKCMTKTLRYPHHITCSSRLNFPQSPDVLMPTTLNLFVYASLGWCKPICICNSDPTNSQAILHIYVSVNSDNGKLLYWFQ